MQLQTELNHLFLIQKEEWGQLGAALRRLDDMKVKTLSWDNQFFVDVQFAPTKEAGTAIKDDSDSLQDAPCFLCETNRPAAQRGIPFLDRYVMLCHPFPILKNHLVIPLHSHVPQRIGKKIGDMLALAGQLPDYAVFYNGPKCGAFTPRHFHFEAGLKTPALLQGDNELRSCLSIDSEDRGEVEELFGDVMHYLRARQPNEEEPMMNVIAFMEQDRYCLHIFPRRAYRSGCYQEEGSRKMLISPAAVDMAGCIVTKREEDFIKIEKQHVEEIFAQVSLPVI